MRIKTSADEDRERKRLISMEAALQNNLRQSSLPMILMEHEDDEDDDATNGIEDDDSPESIAGSPTTGLRSPRSDSGDEPSSPSRGAAGGTLVGSRLRRQGQRKKILEAANKSNKWLLFHDMNLFDDEEIHIIKLFLDIVMHRVPGTFWSDEESLTYENELERIQVSRENSFEGLIVARRENSLSQDNSAASSPTGGSFDETKGLGLNNGSRGNSRSNSRSNSTDRTPLSERLREAASISTAPTPHVLMGDIQNFSLPAGSSFSLHDAQDVIEVYRHEDGKLDVSAVHKLLRLAYRELKESRNVNYVNLDDTDTLIVVGDIHGQLSDLLHILDEAGLPTPDGNVTYIFNGDFVDRGSKSTEVMCVLLALYIASPDKVILNRGNHEDFAICCAYGFQRECCEKYGELTFGMFCELFRQLPLFAVVNDSVMVLHGGLFRNKDVRMQDLHDIDRHEFSLRDMPDGGETLSAVSCLKRKEYLNQLQRDALWSDPQTKMGYAHNSRGAGISFGKDIVQTFLENNKLDMIVRSHECVDRGFELPFIDGPDKPLLCTIFSASNYGGINDGAYMRFRCKAAAYSKAVRTDANLFFDVFSYNIQRGGHLGANRELEPVYLEELLYNKHDEISALMEEADEAGSGEVKSEVWATIMAETTHLKIHWISMVPVLIPDEFVTDLGNIKYKEFLEIIAVDPNEREELPGDHASEDGLVDKLSGGAAGDMAAGHPMINALYTQHKHLETVYRFFDLDNSGAISRDHFESGCELLNKTLTEELHLPESVGVKTYSDLFGLLDIDGSDDVCENSFFELYRIVHTKDKTADAGVDDEGNVHLGLGEIIVRSDSEVETRKGHEFEELMRRTSHEGMQDGDDPTTVLLTRSTSFRGTSSSRGSRTLNADDVDLSFSDNEEDGKFLKRGKSMN